MLVFIPADMQPVGMKNNTERKKERAMRNHARSNMGSLIRFQEGFLGGILLVVCTIKMQMQQ